MPRTISNDMFITGTNPFGPQSREKDEKQNLSPRVPGDAVLEDSKEKQVEKPRLKLPALTRRTTLNNVYENENDLQVLLRVRCFDFPLQVHGLIPESTDDSSVGSVGSSSTSSGQDHDERQTSAKDSLKGKNNVLPLSSSTVLEGQRVHLQGKEESSKQHKTQGKAKERNNVAYQTYSTSQEFDIENAKASNVFTSKFGQQTFQPPRADKFRVTNKYRVTRSDRKASERREGGLSYSHETSRSSIGSLKPARQNTRPTLHVPSVDKYDINPKNIVEVKVCSVFKGNALKAMLIYSGYDDSWIPNRDSRFIKNAVFKAIMQQPAMFLRQPLPGDRTKVTLQENEDLLAKVKTPTKSVETIDNEVTREVKKFVVRLPQIY